MCTAHCSLVIVKSAGFGQQVHIRTQVAHHRRLVAMPRGETLLDLYAAPMPMHIAETADVHQNVKAQSRSRVKGTEGFVMASATPQADLDDFRHAALGKTRDQVA